MSLRKEIFVYIKKLENDIKDLQGRDGVQQQQINCLEKRLYRSAFIMLNGNSYYSELENYKLGGVPVSEIVSALFKQKNWDVVRIEEVPKCIEIREFEKNGSSCRKLK